MANEPNVLVAKIEARNREEMAKLQPGVRAVIEEVQEALQKGSSDRAEQIVNAALEDMRADVPESNDAAEAGRSGTTDTAAGTESDGSKAGTVPATAAAGTEKDSAGRRALEMILAQVYVTQKRWKDAETLVNQLLSEKKEDDLYLLLGQIYHAMGRYQDVVTVMKKASYQDYYPPFYNNTLADALQQLGRKQEALEVFRREADQYRRDGEILSSAMLEGTFQNLLMLEIDLGDRTFDQDLAAYRKFLSEVEMNEQEAVYLTGTIVMMSERLHLKWLRPHFQAFVAFVEEQKLLDGLNDTVLPSAHLALESWTYHEDTKIDSIVESFLSFYAGPSREGEAASANPEVEVTSLTYQWYMCRYYPDHWQVFDYIKEAYPHTYLKITPFLEEFQEKSPAALEEETLDLLMPYVKNKNREEAAQELETVYNRAIQMEKQPVFVSKEGSTYRNAGRKIMPNDPCPCGSGKKYKKCCGRR